MNTFGDYSVEILAERDISFSCSCSKERFGSFLSSMKREEKEKFLKKDLFPF